MDIKAALEVLAALAQDTRLQVFRQLVRAGPAGQAAGEISTGLAARQNTMSSHLKQLQSAGLVTRRRSGRHIIYTANYGRVTELIRFLMEDCCAGAAEVRGPLADELLGSVKRG
ncbi:MAG: metalloregulator ArsR/SmtB family transcription factor [Gammaproteobacteria bacterium]|nr:metalloregulator ArsR/SmtB family transcription factor [Gammaproteobacteria bacterium]